MRNNLKIYSLITLCLIITACTQTEKEWPSQPIEISCFVSAGGGTDTVDRVIASVMKEHLGVPINVVNRTGGNGGVALNYVWSKPKTGYYWGGFSETIHPAPVMGAHQTTADDWHWFMVAGAPDVVSVHPDSPYNTLDDLIQTAKEKPGQLKASAGVTGGLHHTLLISLQDAAGVEFNYLPFPGSHPSQVAVISGEVDLVVTTISEQAEFIKGNRLKPLAMLGDEPYTLEGVGAIPAAAEKYPAIADLPIYQWLGFAVPKGVPGEVITKITDAFTKAMQSTEVKQLAKDRHLTLYGYHGEKAQNVALNMESAWTWALYEMGIAKKSPKEFGIKKPTQ